jgi:hypothetical protein
MCPRVLFYVHTEKKICGFRTKISTFAEVRAILESEPGFIASRLPTAVFFFFFRNVILAIGEELLYRAIKKEVYTFKSLFYKYY